MTSPRVLIVEDEDAIITMMRYNLEAEGFSVMEARDGDAALLSVAQTPPDIVILDWMLPLISGIEICRRLRRDPGTRLLPIIMVTGHTEKARITEARDAGINEFIAKPVSAKSLYRRLVSVIEHPRQFVRTKTYFGPDRRRKVEPFDGPDRRAV